MPDEQGKLSDQEYAKAQKWMEKNANNACVCGVNSWSLAQYVVVQRADTKNLLSVHNYYPSLLLMCRDCGHFRFYGARKAGITPRTSKTEEKEAQNVK